MFPDAYFAPRYFAPRYFPRPAAPEPTPTQEEIHLLEPFYIWDERKELKRKQEEAIIIL